jgi:rhodanese-related sulfurtransferase
MQAMRRPFFCAAAWRQQVADVALVVGGDALQAADRDRLLALAAVRRFVLDAAAPTRRFAGAVAGAPEDAGKDVRHPVDHVGLAVAAGGDQANVFGNGRVGRACPLAIDDFVEIVGDADIGRLQDPDQPVIVICRSGNRTKAASQFLARQAGYQTVYNVRDGIRAWATEGRPLAPAASAVARCLGGANC